MRLYPESDMQEALVLGTFSGVGAEAMDFKQLFLHHIAPGLGCIVAFIMFISPMQAVLQVKRQERLGDLNPLPLVAIVANTLAWLVYGSYTQDIYLVMANEPGLLLGVYMTIVAYGFADQKARNLMLHALLFFAALLSVTSLSISLFVKDPASQLQAAGYQAVGVLLIYYSAPLSSLYEVFRTRSSASLYWPLAMMSCINGSLWVAYGLAVGDVFIWGPNTVGAFFGVLQLCLVCVFPSKPSALELNTPPGVKAPLMGESA